MTNMVMIILVYFGLVNPDYKAYINIIKKEPYQNDRVPPNLIA